MDVTITAVEAGTDSVTLSANFHVDDESIETYTFSVPYSANVVDDAKAALAAEAEIFAARHADSTSPRDEARQAMKAELGVTDSQQLVGMTLAV